MNHEKILTRTIEKAIESIRKIYQTDGRME